MESRAISVCADSVQAQSVLAALKDRIGPQKFQAWFRNGTRLNVEDGCVRVSTANPFVANWIESHYLSEIAASASASAGGEHQVIVSVDPELVGEFRRGQVDCQARLVRRTAEGRTRKPEKAPISLRYRLGEFVVGRSNQMAYSAAVAITSWQDAPFSHIFLHGPCGVGKTHLLQGICDGVRQVRVEGRPVAWKYVTGEQFTNEFVAAVKRKDPAGFREAYRHLDLLVIDDVHFLAAKKATQEEFLHTFNAIQTAGKRIVLASDAHPKLVSELNEQLVSRFVAGMVVKIDLPDRDLRRKLLGRRARQMKLKVASDLLDYLAEHVHGSVRELEGAMVKLAALAALSEEPLTIPVASDALADHLARSDSGSTLGDILSLVATFFGITPADMCSSRRTRTVTSARTVAMFLARRRTRMSYPEIGRALSKNHSSVVIAVQRMEKLLESEGELSWLTPAGPKSLPAREVLRLLEEQLD
jgi:chromosomal replication initiator protein